MLKLTKSVIVVSLAPQTESGDVQRVSNQCMTASFAAVEASATRVFGSGEMAPLVIATGLAIPCSGGAGNVDVDWLSDFATHSTERAAGATVVSEAAEQVGKEGG